MDDNTDADTINICYYFNFHLIIMLPSAAYTHYIDVIIGAFYIQIYMSEGALLPEQTGLVSSIIYMV
jgi:hypothetical protein